MSVQPEAIAPAELQWRIDSTGLGGTRHERERSAPPIILLVTRDRALDQLVAQALLGSSAIVLIARNVSDALQIVCGRGRELQMAVLDVDDACRGMTLLAAMHTCYSELPVLITVPSAEERVRSLAFANGARACLSKPLQVATLANAIAGLSAARGLREDQ